MHNGALRDTKNVIVVLGGAQGDEGDAGEEVWAAAALRHPGKVQQEQAVHGQAPEDVPDGPPRQDRHRWQRTELKSAACLTVSGQHLNNC